MTEKRRRQKAGSRSQPSHGRTVDMWTWLAIYEMVGKIWWSQTGSNRRPPACKAGALPAELWPLNPHEFCAKAFWRCARTGRFICQCAALVNPFLPIFTVFSAAGSLSGKNHADSDQLRRNDRCPIVPAHLPTSFPAAAKLDHWQAG